MLQLADKERLTRLGILALSDVDRPGEKTFLSGELKPIRT